MAVLLNEVGLISFKEGEARQDHHCFNFLALGLQQPEDVASAILGPLESEQENILRLHLAE